MRVIVAKNAGFCFGVRRAVKLARNEAKERGKVYTWGKLIHNEAVIRSLSEEGILPVDDLEDLNAGDTLIIRAHGAPPCLFAECEQRGIRVVDATCPFVARIHPIVQEAAMKGQPVYIAGKRTHPEVIGTAGWAKNQAIILETPEEAERAETGRDGCLVAQTTLSRQDDVEGGDAVRRHGIHVTHFTNVSRALPGEREIGMGKNFHNSVRYPCTKLRFF